MNKRLQIATMLADTIDPPENYYGKKENEKDISQWVEKLFNLADALIKYDNKTSSEAIEKERADDILDKEIEQVLQKRIKAKEQARS